MTATRVVPCPRCGAEMGWDDTPPRPCDECAARSGVGALFRAVVDAANTRALLDAHTHEPFIRYLWRCPRCVAERALLTAAQARLRAMTTEVTHEA